MKTSTKNPKRPVNALIAFLVLSASAATLHAQLIDVNFTGGETYSGAAAIGTSTDIWNNLVLHSSTQTNSTFALSDTSGDSTSTTLTIAGFSGGTLPYGNYGNPDTTIAPNLFQSYLYGGTATTVDTGGAGSATASFDFSHLAASTSYLLEVYDVNSALFAGRDIKLTVNGVTESLTFAQDYTAFSSVLTAPGAYTGNYIPFVVSSDASGKLDISVQNPTDNEYDITGLQLQSLAVPEPSTATLVLPIIGSLLGIVAYQRRRQVGV